MRCPCRKKSETTPYARCCQPYHGGAGVPDYVSVPGTLQVAPYDFAFMVTAQAKAVIFTLVFSGVGSFILFKLVDLLIGDPNKAHQKLGWRHTTTLDEMVTEMVASDLQVVRSERSRRGPRPGQVKSLRSRTPVCTRRSSDKGRFP